MTHFIRSIAVVAGALLIFGAARIGSAQAQSPDMIVTLLGTGTPIPEPGKLTAATPKDRAGPSTLVRAGGEMLLFDTGRGVVERLSQAGVQGRDVTAIFFTHFHSDHTVGMPDFWLTSRLPLAWGRRTAALDVYGPAGVKDLVTGLAAAFRGDTSIRAEKPIELMPHESQDEGVVFERNGVKVTMFKVEHGEAKEAVGYRIDYKGRSVVLSGDTKYHENLIKYGQGADLIVHEVAAAKPEFLEKAPRLNAIFNIHASPQQCGDIFTKTKPKMAAYSHILLMGAPGFPAPVPAPSVDELIAQTRVTYDGPLVAGYDLMSFEIGDKVEVKNPPGMN